MNFEMIWVWVIDTDSSGQNYPGYDKINLIPVDKELSLFVCLPTTNASVENKPLPTESVYR